MSIVYTVVITSGVIKRNENNDNVKRNAEYLFSWLSGGDIRRNNSELL